MQVDIGAAGITCQKLGEAETMVDGGIEDVLIPYNIVGEPKLERLAALLGRARITVSVDDAALLPGLSGAARRAGVELGVLVECDTGLGRAGVDTPMRAIELARAVAGTDGLRFEGFLTYPAPDGAVGFLSAAAEGAAAHGLDAKVVSAGGTPNMWAAGELVPVVNEYRAGTYAFHDRKTVAAGAGRLEDVALTVRATVVSRPARDRAILDTGSKSLASDPNPAGGPGTIVEAPGSSIVRVDEEHGYVSVGEGDGDTLELGRQVTVVPNHACVVANLFDELWLERDGRITGRWRVTARGRSR
jgi:D-serine deaminase-like pyridoxal phosphate-dependent protein